MADQRSTDLDVFSLIRLRWKVIALGCLLGLGAGYLVSRVVTPTYEATGSIVVSQPNSGTVFNSLDDDTGPEQFVNDQASIIKSSPALQEVVARLEERGYDSSFVEFDASSEVEVEDNSNVITVTYTANDAGQAVAGVNLILEVYEERAAEEILRYREAVSNLDLTLQDTADEIADIQADIQRRVRASDGQVSDPEVTLLISRRDQAVARESSLRQTRDRLAIDGRVREETTAVVSSALSARKSSFGPVPTALAGLLTFGMAAFGLAYWLTLNAARLNVENHRRIIQRSRLLTTIALPKPRLPSPRRRRPPIMARIAEGPADDVRNLAELLSLFAGEAANPFAPSVALVTPRYTDWYSALVLEIAIAAEEAGGRVLLVDTGTPRSSLAKLFLAHRAATETQADHALVGQIAETPTEAAAASPGRETAAGTGRTPVTSDTASNGHGHHADEDADADHEEFVDVDVVDDDDDRRMVRVAERGKRRATSKTGALLSSERRSKTASSDTTGNGWDRDTEEDDEEEAVDLDVLAQAVTTVDLVPMSVPKFEHGSKEMDSLTRFLGISDSTFGIAGDDDGNGGDDDGGHDADDEDDGGGVEEAAIAGVAWTADAAAEGSDGDEDDGGGAEEAAIAGVAWADAAAGDEDDGAATEGSDGDDDDSGFEAGDGSDDDDAGVGDGDGRWAEATEGQVGVVAQVDALAVSHRSGKGGRIDYASTTVHADENVPVSTNEIWSLVTDRPAEYDLVLVHAPPLLESTTGIRAAMAVDQVIPLIATGSHRDDVAELMRRLDLFEVPYPGYALVT